MRAAVPGLETPHPLGLAMPGIYHDDDFCQRFLAGFDEVLAPVFCTLDNLDAYFDPALAPEDFVDWLAAWVGIALDENWSVERRRALVAQAAELYRWRGTRRGLAAHVAVYTGSEPEVVDSGGCVWSPVPGGEVPGAWPPQVTVRVRVPDPAAVDLRRIEAIVAAAKPAHVAHVIEVVEG